MRSKLALATLLLTAEFDTTKPIKLSGVLTRVEWVNPHTWLHVDVKAADGQVTSWMLEAGTPNVLFRRGLTKGSVPVGIEVVVDGFQAKDGSPKGSARDLTFPDGRKVFLGADPGSAGAPEEDKK